MAGSDPLDTNLPSLTNTADVPKIDVRAELLAVPRNFATKAEVATYNLVSRNTIFILETARFYKKNTNDTTTVLSDDLVRDVNGIAFAVVGTGTNVHVSELSYPTRASLLADLAHVEHTSAAVYADSDPTLNGIYEKSGASGAGTWTRVRDLPYGIVTLVITGGTANAVVATPSPQMPVIKSRNLFLITFDNTNTGAMTINDGGGTWPIKSVIGGDLVGSEVLPGVPTGMVWVGNHYRLWSSNALDGSTILAQVLAAQVAIEAALAGHDVRVTPLTHDGATASYSLGYSPVSAAALFVTINGAPQRIGSYNVVGSTITFATGTPAGVVEVRDIAFPVTLNAPSAESVGANEIKTGDAAAIRTKIDAVTGPASSVSGNLATWNGVGADTLADSGITPSTDGTMAANSDAKAPTEKAIRTYIENYLTGLKWKPSVQCATTANITLSGEQTIDGVLTSASRVLVKDQSTASQNGIYVSAAGAWLRAADSDSGAKLVQATAFVEGGTVYADTGWTCTNNSIMLGSTSVAFVQFSGAGTYSAGTGLTLTGTQFAISDAELLAIAGLTSAADRLAYFTGSGTAALATFTAFGRTLAALADAAAGLTALGAEAVANKSTDGTFAANSDTLYPSQKAAKTYADTKQSALGFTAENISNKSTDPALGTSTTIYPAQVAVAGAALPNIQSNVVIDGGVNVAQEFGTTGATLVNNTAKWITDQFVGVYNHTAATAVVTSAQVDAASFPAVLPGFPCGHQIKATTAITSPANGDFACHRTSIEGYRVAKWGWGAAGAFDAVYAFVFYSTASFVGFIKASNSDKSRCHYIEITVAAGWNFFSGSIPADTSGAWQKTVNAGLIFEIFSAGVAAAPVAPGSWSATNTTQTTNSTNGLSTNNNLTILTGLYIGRGAIAPTQANLPNLMRSFDEAAQLLRRYLQKSYSYGTAIGTNPTVAGAAFGVATTTLICALPVCFKVPMRTAPAITLYSYVGTSGVVTAQIDNSDTAAASAQGLGEMGASYVQISGLTVGAGYFSNWVAKAQLTA